MTQAVHAVLILRGAILRPLEGPPSSWEWRRGGTVGLAVLAVSSGMTVPCWSPATHPRRRPSLPPAASATLTWRSPTSAPWTGSCWAQRPRPARRPSGSVAPPSRPPSSLPGTTFGSSSTRTPPAPARPRASVSHTSEVMPVVGRAGHLSVCTWAPGGPGRHPPSTHPLQGLPQQTGQLEPSVGMETGHVAAAGCLGAPRGH